MTNKEIGNYFIRLQDEEDDFQVKRFLKDPITFEQRDIRNSLPDRAFDLILCRNLVFTYFTQKHQLDFLDRLQTILKPDSHLVIGANEQLPPVNWLQPVNQTHRIYQPR